MKNFIMENGLQDGNTLLITQVMQFLNHARGDIQPTRLQHPGYQRHAHHRVEGGFGCHLPQSVMGGQITILMAKLTQPLL